MGKEQGHQEPLQWQQEQWQERKPLGLLTSAGFRRAGETRGVTRKRDDLPHTIAQGKGRKIADLSQVRTTKAIC
jgi:hypothetical protein